MAESERFALDQSVDVQGFVDSKLKRKSKNVHSSEVDFMGTTILHPKTLVQITDPLI